METPAIALRFRDTTPGIDTIEAHREVLSQHGAVWWGWWKKEFEEGDAATVEQKLPSITDRRVLLVNRAREQCYVAHFSTFANIAGVDLERVPAYYRDYLREIPGCFLLTSIESADYDRGMAERFGEHTLLWTHERELTPVLQHTADTAEAPGRSCVLHLSDLHFGSDYGFRSQGERPQVGDRRRTLTETLVGDLSNLGVQNDIAAVVVSGDFMTQGDWNDRARHAALAEFEALRRDLSLEKNQIIAVPGNHDIVRYPGDRQIDVAEIAVGNQANYQHEREFRTFVDELIDRDWRETLNYVRRVRLHEVDLVLCVMNSCTITATQWTEYGFVGPNGLDALRQLAREQITRPTFKFLALHHHLLPVADVEAPQSRGVTLTLDASEILYGAQKAGVHVILHGHQHKPKLSVYQDLPLRQDAAGPAVHVIANGSAGAKLSRLPDGERNTYCLFRLNARGVELWMRELRLDGRPGAELFHGELATPPPHSAMPARKSPRARRSARQRSPK